MVALPKIYKGMQGICKTKVLIVEIIKYPILGCFLVSIATDKE
jgi:hypothetical protein